MALYDEDLQYPNRIYDPQTGRSNPTAYVDIVSAEAQEAVLRAESLQSMRDSQGFKILETFLIEQISQIKDSLPYIDKDPGKLLRLQEAVKCYQNVLDYMDQQIRIGMFHKQSDNSTIK